MKSKNADVTDSLQHPSQEPDAISKVTPFWGQYVEEAEKYDEAFLEKNKIRMEGVLVFAGLFSAVTASFLAAMQGTLSPNPSDTTNALLMILVHSIDNSTFSNQTLGIPTWNGPAYSSVLAQALGYAALSISLLASFGAVLGKQWLSDYAASKIGSLLERGSRRQQRLDALEKWGFEVFMETLPTLIQLALLLFGVALSITLWELNKTVGYVIISVTALGVLFYLFVTVASLLYPACPFRTPLSSIIQEATRIVAKSVEEIAEYWAWRCDRICQKRPEISPVNKKLAYLAILPFALLIVMSIIPIIVLVSFCSILALVIGIQGGADNHRTWVAIHRLAYPRALRERFHKSACVVRDSARRIRDFIRWTCQDPQPDTHYAVPRSVAWLLRTSTHPEKFIAALELVPDIAWPEDFNFSLLGEGPHNLFSRLIPEMISLKDRALPLGKALVVLLSRMPQTVHFHHPTEILQQLDKIVSEQTDLDSDLLFILVAVAKLLRIKLGLVECQVEFPTTREVSQPLLVWLLQPLEVLLRLDHPRQSCFLPETYRVFLKLKWPEESRLERAQEIQYCRTFEVYFNCVLGLKCEQTDKAAEQNPRDSDTLQAGCLKRILEKLKEVDTAQLSHRHQRFIVPLAVISRLATIPHLKQVIKDVYISPWVLAAFKEVMNADESNEGHWLFASCLMRLAEDVDAFNPIGDQVKNSERNGDGYGLIAPLLMDSKSLLLYLLNKESPATSEQVVYALRTILANVDEHFALASDPQFVNYILYATSPGQEDDVRDIGLKVLVSTCQSLLHAHDTNKVIALAANCDLVRFLHHAILNEDPPTMLKDLLEIDDEDFKANLTEILAPVLGDPFNELLTKLCDEPNKIPERDLRDLEIVLVLSNDEGRKKLLLDHLDRFIAMMPLQDYPDTMALPLATIVSWLLRQGGPLGTSDSIWKAFLRPNFESLLLPAWGDRDVLEDNPQLLRLLLDCTAKWLPTHNPEMASESESPTPATLARLGEALDQLRNGSLAFPLDIKRAMQKLSREIKRHYQD